MKTLLLLFCVFLLAIGSATKSFASPKHSNTHHHHKFHKQLKYDVHKTTRNIADSSLINKAKQYVGTNPTGWASVWCGNFMRMVVRLVTGQDFRDGNSARAWTTYGSPGGPEPGNLVIFARGTRGGHVGLVEANLGNGRILVLSGNHGHRVAEAIYSTRAVIAYRRPS